MNNFLKLLICTIPFFTMSCKKYLDEKQDQQLQIPSTLEDLQAILDDNNNINRLQNNAIGEASADNYYLTDNDWSTLFLLSDKSIYSWEDEMFYNNPSYQNDWAKISGIVYRANLVLETLDEVTLPPGDQYNAIKGSALFLRGYAQFILAVNFARAYDPASAETDLGIPVWRTTNFNGLSVRLSVAESYAKIIEDVSSSTALLPLTPQHVMRPSRSAAYALLSRIYLSMRDYARAGAYADSCLQLKDDLVNYNNDPSINPAAPLPFSKFNSEVLFHAEGIMGPLYNNVCRIDSALYATYEDGDLRKTLFFKTNTDGSHAFIGNYTNAISLFVGLATDEVYLTRAECFARAGNTPTALSDLNYLLEHRWDPAVFVPVSAGSAGEAIATVLAERRKELLMRDIRWMDIKRLNKEGEGIVISRHLNGQTISLSPEDNRYALPLPKNVIDISGMQQNPR